MDEEFRRVLRYGDLDELKRRALYAPAEVLAEAYATLKAEADEINKRLAVIGVVAPRCHCGEIGEPYCAAHTESLESYLQLKNTYVSMGLFARWVNGEDINRRDAVHLIKLHQTAGCPETKECDFPTCPNGNGYGFCSRHWGKGYPQWSRSLRKDRERL